MTNRISTAEKFTGYQKIVLTILALLLFVVMLDFMIIAPIGDILIKSLNITTKQFGLVVSSYIFSAAITGFVDVASCETKSNKPSTDSDIIVKTDFAIIFILHEA